VSDLAQRIAAARPDLAPQERRAAATLLAHLDDLAAYRAAELADLAGVSKATMSRLVRRLGYADHDQLREQARDHRRPAPGQPGGPGHPADTGSPRTGEGPVDPAAYAAAEADAVLRAVTHPHVPQAVRMLHEADRLTVVGWRNSHPVALHLRQQLTHVRGDVRLAPLPGQVVGEELSDVGPGDVVVVVGFRRRPAGFGAFLDEARARGARVLLVADPSAADHACAADLWLECPLGGALSFDSYAAPMALVAVLADGVLSARGRGGETRVAEVTARYERLGEIEQVEGAAWT